MSISPVLPLTTHNLLHSVDDSVQVVELSVNVTNNSPSRDYSQPNDQTKQTTETPEKNLF